MIYDELKERLKSDPREWLVTGVAGFIGSNLLEALLKSGQLVMGIDNFSTGFRENLESVRAAVGESSWERFKFKEGDIADPSSCKEVCRGVAYVLHQAAIGSVPRSFEQPVDANRANLDGFLNMLVASRESGVRRFVYASSSSVYGNDETLPKVEERTGDPLSPYAVTKQAGELYAKVFAQDYYRLANIGLRYFNVFGPRQNPGGAYAAVIPKWIDLLLKKKRCTVFGDGETSRDFCYVENIVQANLLAAITGNERAVNQVYNIGYGRRTTLNQLYSAIRDGVAGYAPEVAGFEPIYSDFRRGDIRHTEADVGKAERLLGYHPSHSLEQGLAEAMAWFVNNLGK